MVDNLQDAKDNVEAAMGAGYTEARKQSVQAEIDFWDGDSGKEMEDAYKQIGIYKASLDNLKDQLNRDALNSVVSGTVADSFKDSEQLGRLKELIGEYKQAQKELSTAENTGDTSKATEARAAMGRALEEARVMAANEYNASEGAQLELQSQQQLASRIAGDAALQGTYYNAGYTMGQQFSKGLQAAISGANLTATPSVTINSPHYNTGGWTKENSGSPSNGNGPTLFYPHKAFGMPFVPYDDYPAVLHYGERVLTANQARQQESLGGGALVSGNTFVIREESDIDKVATVIVQKLMLAKLLKV